MTYSLDLDEVTGRITLRGPTTATPIVRQIPGARHDAKRQLWTFPLSWATCVTARGVLGSQLEVSPRLAEWARFDRMTRREPVLELREAFDIDLDSAAARLLEQIETSTASEACAPSDAPRRPTTTGDDSAPSLTMRGITVPRLHSYQRPGAIFLTTAGSALFGWDMGTGKTPMAIRAMQLLAADGHGVVRALVVCPNSAKHQWARRFAEWAPEFRVVVARSGTVNARKAIAAIEADGADVLVLNWEALPNLSRLAPYGSIELQGCTDCDPLSTRPPSRCQRSDKELNKVAWELVIADEAHRAKEPSAQQTRALWAIGDKAQYRWALTGSPPERPDALWTLLRFVSPNEYPGKIAFLDRYAVMAANIWSGFPEPTAFKPERREEFDRFFLPRFMRRPYAVVDQTEPVRERRDVELSGKQLKAYNDFRKSLLAEVQDGVIYTSNPLTKLLRLRQLASAYGEADGNGGMRIAPVRSPTTNEDDEHYLNRLAVVPSSKLDVLGEVLDELGDRQVVIFAESAQLLALAGARLTKHGIRYGRIVGDVSPEGRDRAVEQFIRGDIRVMLCTVGAGGEAIDGLQVTNVAIFLQRPWSRQLSTQAEGRIHRLGQEGTPLFIDLVTTGTVEEAVLDTLADKAEALEDLVHDAETLRRWLS